MAAGDKPPRVAIYDRPAAADRPRWMRWPVLVAVAASLASGLYWWFR